MAEREGPVTEGRILTSKGPIAREVHFLVYATVVLYVVIVSVIVLGAVYLLNNQATNRRLGKEGQAAHQGLCAFRENLENQVVSSTEYLADVKAGRRQPIPNITSADIQAGINRQQATIDALVAIDCRKETP